MVNPWANPNVENVTDNKRVKSFFMFFVLK